MKSYTGTFLPKERLGAIVAVMAAERPRVTYDVPEEIKRAINIFAARKGFSVSEAIEWMVHQLLEEDLEIAKREIELGTVPPPKRGRP